MPKLSDRIVTGNGVDDTNSTPAVLSEIFAIADFPLMTCLLIFLSINLKSLLSC